MRALPFACLRPNPDKAAGFASLPYDVFDRAEAAAYVAAHPSSFLAIDRPETAFAPEHDMYADDVYDAARRILEERAADGTLMRDPNKCYYLYRLAQNGRSQTGIVATRRTTASAISRRPVAKRARSSSHTETTRRSPSSWPPRRRPSRSTTSRTPRGCGRPSGA